MGSGRQDRVEVERVDDGNRAASAERKEHAEFEEGPETLSALIFPAPPLATRADVARARRAAAALIASRGAFRVHVADGARQSTAPRSASRSRAPSAAAQPRAVALLFCVRTNPRPGLRERVEHRGAVRVLHARGTSTRAAGRPSPRRGRRRPAAAPPPPPRRTRRSRRARRRRTARSRRAAPSAGCGGARGGSGTRPRPRAPTTPRGWGPSRRGRCARPSRSGGGAESKGRNSSVSTTAPSGAAAARSTSARVAALRVRALDLRPAGDTKTGAALAARRRAAVEEVRAAASPRGCRSVPQLEQVLDPGRFQWYATSKPCTEESKNTGPPAPAPRRRARFERRIDRDGVASSRAAAAPTAEASKGRAGRAAMRRAVERRCASHAAGGPHRLAQIQTVAVNEPADFGRVRATPARDIETAPTRTRRLSRHARR